MGTVVPVWSPLIIAEVNRLLTWLWLKRAHGDHGDAAWKRCSEASRAWFSVVTRVFRVVDDHPPYEQGWVDEPADTWDIPIWTAAVRAQQRFPGAPVFIVTDNLKDGPPGDSQGLQHYRDVGFIHPVSFISLISAWAEVMHSSEQEELGLPPSNVRDILRMVSAPLSEVPDTS